MFLKQKGKKYKNDNYINYRPSLYLIIYSIISEFIYLSVLIRSCLYVWISPQSCSNHLFIEKEKWQKCMINTMRWRVLLSHSLSAGTLARTPSAVKGTLARIPSAVGACI